MKKLIFILFCTMLFTSCCTDYEAVVTTGTPVYIEGRPYYYYHNQYYWEDRGSIRIYHHPHRSHHYEYQHPVRPRRPQHDGGRRR